MKFNKRWLVSVALLLAAVIGLTACVARPSPTASPEAAPSTPARLVTVGYRISGWS